MTVSGTPLRKLAIAESDQPPAMIRTTPGVWRKYFSSQIPEITALWRRSLFVRPRSSAMLFQSVAVCCVLFCVLM